MGLEIIAPGHFTTLQDLGRPGYAARGVPRGGAFDHRSHALANALLGNGPKSATLEMTLMGGTYRAGTNLALALAGAPMEATVESLHQEHKKIDIPSSFTLAEGEVLRIGHTPAGARTYLAVKGGWLTPLELSSRSRETPILAGQRLEAPPSSTPVRRPNSLRPPRIDDDVIRIIEGPDIDQALDFEQWIAESFRVGNQANRMGLRLSGPSLMLENRPERVSMPVATGAMQIAGGQLIILGVACGTIGGYPHVGHVISADLHRLGQLRPGAQVRFARVAMADARRIDHEERRFYRDLHRRLSTMTTDPWGAL